MALEVCVRLATESVHAEVLQGQGERQGTVPMERTAALRGRTRTHKFAVMPGKRAAYRGPAAAPPIKRETSTAPKVRQQASSAGKHSRADPAKAQTEPKARLSGQVAGLWGYAQEWVPGPASTISVSRRKTFGFDPDPTVEYMLRLEIRYKCEPCCRPPSTPVRQHRTAKDAPVIAHRLAALLQRELSKGSLSHASPYNPFILSTPKSAGTSNLPLATVLDQELSSLSLVSASKPPNRPARGTHDLRRQRSSKEQQRPRWRDIWARRHPIAKDRPRFENQTLP